MNAPEIIAPWLVAYTEPRAELRAKDGIEDIGGEVFLPLEKISRQIQRRNLWKRIERPLFSRYIFVRPRLGQWARLLLIDGVVDILRNNDIPSTIPPTWIEALRKAEAFGVFDRTRGAPDPFKIGELVKISAGPFAGHSGIIEKFIAQMRSSTAKKRAKVLLNFVGQQARVDIDIRDLAKR